MIKATFKAILLEYLDEEMAGEAAEKLEGGFNVLMKAEAVRNIEAFSEEKLNQMGYYKIGQL